MKPVTESLSKSFSISTPRVIDKQDDESTHNASSVIFMFIPEGSNGRKYLFAGDATRRSFEIVKENLEKEIANCYWLKIPHHGSFHNLTTDIYR